MRFGLKRRIPTLVPAFVACFLANAPGHAQSVAEQKPKLAEEAFKNVKVLRGMSSNEFMETMSFFSASLGANCNYCHVEESGGDWGRYADDSVPQKVTARRMVVMVAAMNKMYFGGRRELTCYSCHRGGERPKVIPNLDDLYGPPLAESTDDFLEQSPKTVSADQILNKYLAALGGAKSLDAVTSFIGKGTYQGFDTPKQPFEIYAKTPDQRATVVHTAEGDSITVYDGRSGWTAAPASERPVTLSPLTGSDLEGVRVDGAVAFPARIPKAFTEWKVGFPTAIDDRDMVVLQGSGGGHATTRFYFDKSSGLLARLVRYTETPAGLSPTRYDYSDYRDVAGVKMPFHWVMTWLGGRATVELNEIQANVPIDAAKFSKPAAPASTR